MIEEIEELMKHWGHQCCRVGDGGGLGSPMATIMEAAALPVARRGLACLVAVLVWITLPVKLQQRLHNLSANQRRALSWPSWPTTGICRKGP